MILSFSLVKLVCVKCGIPFAIPSHLERQRSHDENPFFCPNGHKNHYIHPLKIPSFNKGVNK